MTMIYVFGGSLAGLVALLLFKVIEMRHGIKPLSALRYQADMSIRRKAEEMLSYSRYISWRTFWLLMLFLAIETRKLVAQIFGWLKETKLGAMVRGKLTIQANPSQPTSPFLQGMTDALKK